MRWFYFIGIIQSILFLGHWFLYKTLVRFFGPTNPAVPLALRTAMVLLSVSLVATSLLASRYSNLFVRFLYAGASSWLGILYLSILASILCWIFYGLAGLFHFHLNPKMLITILIGIALLASLYGFVNSGFIRVTRVNLVLPHPSYTWKGKTAVWVSDTHLGQIRNYGFAQRIATMVQNIHPDIVFIGGDLYDGTAVDLDRVIEPLSRISTPYGVYFITGNHEEFSNKTPYLQAVKRAGIRLLNNEKVDLDGLQIIGVDYMDSRSEESFRGILQNMGIDRHKPSILLKHSPLHLRTAEEQGISFQLSGHTHHGQVFLFRWITSQIYQGYDYGLNRRGNLFVYTSSGAGTWGPPMRLDTKPEIVVIKFI